MAGRPKRRAKTGGRKPGVSNKPRAELLEEIKRELRSRHLLAWPDEWDPVCRMAVLAEKALLSNDPYLALAALKEVARYTRAPLQAEPARIEDEPRDTATMSAIGQKFNELMRRSGDAPALEDKRDEIPKAEYIEIEGEAVEVTD